MPASWTALTEPAAWASWTAAQANPKTTTAPTFICCSFWVVRTLLSKCTGLFSGLYRRFDRPARSLSTDCQAGSYRRTERATCKALLARFPSRAASLGCDIHLRRGVPPQRSGLRAARAGVRERDRAVARRAPRRTDVRETDRDRAACPGRQRRTSAVIRSGHDIEEVGRRRSAGHRDAGHHRLRTARRRAVLQGHHARAGH